MGRLKRTRAQRRRMLQGYTHEITYWSFQGKSYNFILLLGPEYASYFRKQGDPDDWIRPVCPQFIHNGRRPR